MSKKLMLLVAGALMALAFTSLAGTAAAKETKLKCEGAGECTYAVSGGITQFSIVGGDTVKCSSVTGNGTMTSLDAERESTTSNVQLLFENCREQNTPFEFLCTNTATAGNVTTGVMVSHNIALPAATTGAGVLLTNAGVTFTCAGGFASTQVTGQIIGESETKCGENTSTVQKQVFATTSDGVQAFTSYTSSTFKLEGKTSHTGSGTYAGAAQSGTGTLTFNQKVILTCA